MRMKLAVWSQKQWYFFSSLTILTVFITLHITLTFKLLYHWLQDLQWILGLHQMDSVTVMFVAVSPLRRTGDI